MRRNKSAQKTGGKKASAGRKLSGRKKSTQRKKAARLPRGRKSAQIHQGVGPEAQTEPPEIPDDATEYGGES